MKKEDCKSPGSNADPTHLGEQEDMGLATRSAEHLKEATGVIPFFMSKCTHIYVDPYVRTLLMCVAHVWVLCPCTNPLGEAAQLCYRQKLRVGTHICGAA